MSEKKEVVFVKGMYAKRTKVDFIVANISIKTVDFLDFIKSNTNDKGYCNIDVVKSKDDGLYCKLNDFVPTEKKEVHEAKPVNVFKNTSDNNTQDDLPF